MVKLRIYICLVSVAQKDIKGSFGASGPITISILFPPLSESPRFLFGFIFPMKFEESIGMV